MDIFDSITDGVLIRFSAGSGSLADTGETMGMLVNIAADDGMTSKDLKTALEDGKRIIVTTLQKFGVIEARKQCVKVKAVFDCDCLMRTVINAQSLANTPCPCSMPRTFSHTLAPRATMSKMACC